MDRAIGIFDSGLGGLTVFKEVQRWLPNEHLIYFGDTARVPYGGKSPETILRYSKENAAFLMQHSIKALVIACNTAASHTIGVLDDHFEFPIIDVIQPAAETAVRLTKSARIAVLGTKATIKSGIYKRKIQELLPSAEVIEIACPLLVPLVEEDFISHPSTRLIIREYLKPLRKNDIDVLVLGCTHYPFLTELIREEIDHHIVILDSAEACAKKVADRLKQNSLLAKGKGTGNAKFFVSDDPERFRAFGERFLGVPLTTVEIGQ